MKTFFKSDGSIVRGFLGTGKHGNYFVARPDLVRKVWEVFQVSVPPRCQDKISDFTPEQLDEFSSERDIDWLDQGNGIYLYSRDMEDPS